MPLNHTPGRWRYVEREDRYDIEAETMEGKIVVIGSINKGLHGIENARIVAGSLSLYCDLVEAMNECPCTEKQRRRGHKPDCSVPVWDDDMRQIEQSSPGQWL